MGIGTPLHNKTSALCKSLRWKEWAGYFSVESYDTCHELEYIAIRHSAGMMDGSPLYKYEIRGADAQPFMNYVIAKNVRKIKDNQAAYCCWCDEYGKIIDDGVVLCFNKEHYQITAANPSLRWFRQNSVGLDVQIEDISQDFAVISLQGPTSRSILQQLCDEVSDLKFFYLTRTKLAGEIDAVISRTGYTGDLGYEIWIAAKDAERTWDLLMENGYNYGITPNGLDALDVARIEAGFILIDVDFYSSRKAFVEFQKSTPYEIGLGWTVNLKKPDFIGKSALMAEKERGIACFLVGLEVDWDELEYHFSAVGLPPNLPHGAWRETIPIYNNKKRQIGRATSGCWSPTLKKNIALATVDAGYEKPGTKIKIETMVEYERKLVTARVVEKPFFDPPRKRS